LFYIQKATPHVTPERGSIWGDIMKLYEFKRTRSYKIRWLLKELGVDCEYKTVNLMEGEHQKSDFLKLNPFGKVPTFVDGDLRLHEASAICNYLADKYPNKGLIPKPATNFRAIYDKWNFFASNELECHLWTCEKHSWFYPEEKRSSLAIEMAKSDFSKAIKIVNDTLSDKKFLLGTDFSVLDINYAYLIRWGKSHNLIQEYPRLIEYLNGLIDRPAYPRELFD
jgi:glutathione S-transferase